ncbi:dicarboxylate/amino acid:cation symporter [Paludibacterium sp. THUN1379]|uniref:dicarboxylate/amino acid:cation symporter n=1 Tax=Paludibacterium sp. THUN1379 TaxID=3112107 RepID=UPI0030CCDE81
MAIFARKSLPPWLVILLSMVSGVLAGLLLGQQAQWLKPLGDLFVALIRMMVMPVIFVSLVCAVTALNDLSRMRRIAVKTLLIYALTMMLSAILSMVLAETFSIGKGLHYAHQSVVQDMAMDWSSLMPTNPVQAMAQGQVLPVMLFSLLFGLAINLCGEAARPVTHFFDALNQVIFRLISMLLRLAPLGVFALMAWVTANNGLGMLSQLASLVGTLYLSCLLVLTVVYGGLLRLAGLNPLPFMNKMLPVQLFAFSTCSSNAALPMTLDTANRLGVRQTISAFVLPLGSTINMNGLATYLGAVAIFAANAAGVELSLLQKLMVVLTTTLGAMGAAGVPGTGLVVMSLVLSSVGLPLEVIAIVAAVDRIIDMINTSTNISGDALAAVLVAKSEGEFDDARYAEVSRA